MITALFGINKLVEKNHQRRINDPEKQIKEGIFLIKKKVYFAVKVHVILI